MQRYFINEYINETTKIIEITRNDYHHIKNVMRMKVKDKVYICTKEERTFIFEILLFQTDSVVLQMIEEVTKKVELDIEVTIALGLVRREKTEEVLRRITELGANEFVSVEMERSIVQLKNKSKQDHKLDRMRMIVKEASEQSHRTRLLEVLDVKTFKEFLNYAKQFDLCLYAYEESGRDDNYNLKKYLQEWKGKKLLVLIGPEGGISSKEVGLLNQNQFFSIGLGPRILRAETAPLYVMAAISYELELK